MERSEVLSFEEIERLAGIFVGLGVEKIRLTGGEPLVRRNLHRLIERLAPMKGLDSFTMVKFITYLRMHILSGEEF